MMKPYCRTREPVLLDAVSLESMALHVHVSWFSVAF